MIFSKTLFLEAYSQLHQPASKTQANQYILRLEKSEEAWLVGRELLEDANANVRLQGALLLSKKATAGLPNQFNITETVQYLFGQAQKTTTDRLTLNQICMCIAKLIATNLECFTSVIKQLAKMGCHPVSLSILKEIPQSILCVNQPIILNQEDWRSFYSLIKPVLLDAIRNNTLRTLSLECLHNMCQFSKVRILKSSEICELIVGLPIEETTSLLLQAFSDPTENVADLQSIVRFDEYIWAATTGNPNESFIRMFLDFVRLYVHSMKTQLNLVRLEAMIHKALQYISIKRQYTMQSFELWMDLESLSEQSAQVSKLQLVWSTQLIQLIMKQSRLKKLIETAVQRTEEIVIDDDQEDEAIQLTGNNPVNSCLSFREYATDFIRICYKSIRGSQEAQQWFFSSLDSLCQANELDCQLCIFVIKNIVDLMQNQYGQIYETLLRMVRHGPEFTNDLLIPLLQLLYDSDQVILSNQLLLEESLLLFMKTFGRPAVVRLSTQTLNNLVSSIKQLSAKACNSIQSFMSEIYGHISEISDQVVLENILGAMIALISKTADPFTSYQEFLVGFESKVGVMPVQRKVFFYKALFISHLCHVEKQEMFIKMANYFDQIYNPLLEEYLNSSDKKNRTNIMHIFNAVAKKTGKYGPLAMYTIASKLIQEADKKKFSETSCLYFLSNILNDTDTMYKNAFIKEVWQPMLPKLLSITPRPDLSKILVELFSKTCQYTSCSVQLQYAASCLSNLPFNYEMIRQILKFFIVFVRVHRTEVNSILLLILSRYRELVDPFWMQVFGLLTEIYRVGGRQTFQSVLRNVKPQLLSPNPLFDTLLNGLEQSDSKTIKNVLMCLC